MSALRRSTRCPPDHDEYPSEFVAENAATLHRWIAVGCELIEAFPCGDHWHIGHRSHVAGELCKASYPFTRIRRY